MCLCSLSLNASPNQIQCIPVALFSPPALGYHLQHRTHMRINQCLGVCVCIVHHDADTARSWADERCSTRPQPNSTLIGIQCSSPFTIKPDVLPGTQSATDGLQLSPSLSLSFCFSLSLSVSLSAEKDRERDCSALVKTSKMRDDTPAGRKSAHASRKRERREKKIRSGGRRRGWRMRMQAIGCSWCSASESHSNSSWVKRVRERRERERATRLASTDLNCFCAKESDCCRTRVNSRSLKLSLVLRSQFFSSVLFSK